MRKMTDRRNETHRETLLDGSDESLLSRDELIQQCHRALSAQLWTTCCWPAHGSGWNIGDFRYLVVSAAPDADARLYVQFWSEPRQRVMTEVSSGEWSPGTIRYIGPTERHALEARGYIIGGRARNYGKELVIDSVAAAEAAAMEVLHLFFDVFGYRGQWRLNVERHRGGRTEHHPVLTSVTPDDFAHIAVRAGCEATVKTAADTPFVVLRRGRREFLALMEWQVPGQQLFSLIALQADLRLTQPVPNEAIAWVNSSMHLVKVSRTGDDRVRLSMPLVVSGGVTADWIAQSLQHWIKSWRVCERQLRRFARTSERRPAPGAELVH
jgi:hypothetical protein